LVELIGKQDGVRVSKVAEALGADLTVLPGILEAGEVLGLIFRSKGRVWLSELGSVFLRTPDHKLMVLKDALASVEPFRTALNLTPKGGSVTSKQVASALYGHGIRWDYQPAANYATVNALMINWSILAGLFGYEKSQRFLKLL